MAAALCPARLKGLYDEPRNGPPRRIENGRNRFAYIEASYNRQRIPCSETPPQKADRKSA